MLLGARSVTTRRCIGPKAADEKRQWCDGQCGPAEYAEAVHVSEQMGLVAKLAIDVRHGGRVSITGGNAALREEGGQGAYALFHKGRCLWQ